jgi:hypothetical protein
MDSLSSVFGHTISNPCLESFNSTAANTRGVSGLNSSSGAFTMASPSPAAKQNEAQLSVEEPRPRRLGQRKNTFGKFD